MNATQFGRVAAHVLRGVLEREVLVVDVDALEVVHRGEVGDRLDVLRARRRIGEDRRHRAGIGAVVAAR